MKSLLEKITTSSAKKIVFNSASNKTTLETGQQYEQTAKRFLIKKGFKHIQSNYSCRQGEIDLIMLDNDTLVFIEVRYRSRPEHGSALESVNYHKQRKIKLCAEHFLSIQTKYSQHYCRFDVIGFDSTNLGNNKVNEQQMHWVKNAFME